MHFLIQINFDLNQDLNQANQPSNCTRIWITFLLSISLFITDQIDQIACIYTNCICRVQLIY